MTAQTAPDTAADMHRRPDMEAWLDERHTAWTFHPAFALGDVDQIASLANQARLEPVDEEVVDRYTADMERGDQFPPLLAVKKGRKIVLLGGNHRYAAHKAAGHNTAPLYLLDPLEPEMATRLMYEDNRRHGLPPSEEERLHQAVHLCETGYTQDQAAEAVGVSVKKVQQAVGTARADRRARDLNIRGWDKLPKSSRWRLGQLRSDPVFKALGQLVCDTAMATSEVFLLVTRINNARSDNDALQSIALETENRRGQIQSSAGGAIRRNIPSNTLRGYLGGISCLDPTAIAASCHDQNERAQLRTRIGDTVKQLNAIAGKL